MNVEPGMYALAISGPGFRELFIQNVIVENGSEVDLGKMNLSFAGCEAPGLLCEYLAPDNVNGRRLSQGYLVVPFECAVDLDRGDILCPPNVSRNSDFRFAAKTDGQVYLEPLNGARLAEPNSAGINCEGAAPGTREVRVDGLGMGSDVCLRTNKGRYSHLFFTDDILPGRDETKVYFVTRK